MAESNNRWIIALVASILINIMLASTTAVFATRNAEIQRQGIQLESLALRQTATESKVAVIESRLSQLEIVVRNGFEELKALIKGQQK